MELKTWRLIDSGLLTPELNMAIDEALLKNFKENDLPILRLYGWEPSISVGRFTNVHKSVDLSMLKDKRVSCVRRMTGGGILIHDDDLSYSLIFSRKWAKSKGVKENYRYICGFLIHLFYAKLGHKAKFATDLNLNVGHSNICMAANEEYDIIIDGKKIGGNAQRYVNKALFQHGSIPMSMDKSRYRKLFLEDSGIDRVATLEQLGNLLTYKEFAKLLVESFCETFNVTTRKDTLSQAEIITTEELLKNKYSQRRWNFYAQSYHP